jgi:hypothetical protein
VTEESGSAMSGWVSPGPDRRGRGRLLLVGAGVIVVLFIVGSFIAVQILDRVSPGTSDIQSLAFGTGGSECQISGLTSTFRLGESVRSVVTFEPALQAGDTVSITVERDGTELIEQRDTVTMVEPAPCIHSTWMPTDTGHYRVVYTIDPSAVPPIEGAFDVLP